MSGAARHLDPTVEPGYSALSTLEPARRAVVEEALRHPTIAQPRNVYLDSRAMLKGARAAAVDQRPTTLAALREIVTEHAALYLYSDHDQKARDDFEEAVGIVAISCDTRSVPIGRSDPYGERPCEWRGYTLARGILALEVAAEPEAYDEVTRSGDVVIRITAKKLRARERVIAAEVAT